MKIGEMVTLDKSTRKNGQYAGKVGMINSRDKHMQYVILVDGDVRAFHSTQIQKNQ